MSITSRSPRQRTKRYPAPSIRKKQARTRSKDQFCFEHTRGRRSGCVHCWLCSLRVRPSKAGKPEGSQDNWGPIATTGYVPSSRCQISARLVDSTRHEAVWMDEIPRRRAFSAGLLEARCWSQQSNQLADCVGIALRRSARSNRLAKPLRRSGGARRDRTDDLMLAKHALSQLSYGPELIEARSRRHAR